jgi:tetratricopeptide (TPR) repeat protein
MAADALAAARGKGRAVSDLALGRALWVRGDLETARTALAAARARGEAPADYLDLCLRGLPLALARMAEESRQRGDIPAALERYARLLAVDPHDMRSLRRRAEILLDTGDLRGAARDFGAVQKRDVRVRAHLTRHAELALRAGQYPRAAALCSVLIEIQDDDATNRYRRGVARQHAGDAAGARADLDRALALVPPGAPTTYELRTCIAQAHRPFGETGEHTPTDAEVHDGALANPWATHLEVERLRRATARGDATAAAQLRGLADRHPRHAAARFARAWLASRDRRYDDAARELDALIQAHTGAANLHLARAVVRHAQHRPQDAASDAAQARALAPAAAWEATARQWAADWAPGDADVAAALARAP